MRAFAVGALVGALATGVGSIDPAPAQTAPRLGGYYEHQLSGSLRRGDGSYLDYDRFRVNLDQTAGAHAAASIGVVYQLYRGDTRVPLAGLLPRSLAGLVDTASVEIADRHFVNHLYLSLRAGPVELVAGKQYLAWGAAAVFNPTELFRPKNPFEPGYDREGLGAITTKLALGPLSELLVAVVPDGGFERSGKVARARHHVGGVDLSALVAETHEPIAAATPGGGRTLARRRALGGDFSAELAGFGVWGEALYSWFDGARWLEASAGGNYTLGDGTRLTLEGYFNGRGEGGAPYRAESWLARISGDRRSLGRVLLYGGVSRTVTELWTVGGSAIANPGDGSAALIPLVGYSLAQNVDLLFNGFVSLGDDESELGAGGTGAFLRARIYY
ncbi:MAG: hypothetical protein AB7R55_22930 [Gemmatimonadales bacterium]